jgi:predicted enzyme related to lactoylglutathione lyase
LKRGKCEFEGVLRLTAAVTREDTGIQIQGVMEVILHIMNMGAMVSFYRDKLGLKLSYPTTVQDFAKENWVTFNTGACIFVLHGGGRVRTGEQPSHRITFQVANVKAAREYFVNRGVQLGEVRSPAPGVWVADGRDPEGNVYALESHS